MDKWMIDKFRPSFKRYWPLIKSLQTGLLLFTGLAGFVSARCPYIDANYVLGLLGSLFLSISGSTVLNMVYDRDIDAKMERTCLRPLPAGTVSPSEALYLGLGMSILGIAWAVAIDVLYGAVVFAGLFFDVVFYTMLLKRRTAWSVVWGGIAGGMPVLAGRVLAVGMIDWVGIALAFAVLFWIPTHILTFSIRYKEDYTHAGIPTFPSRYGVKMTQRIIAFSSILASVAMGISAIGIGLTWGYLRVLIVLSTGLLLFAVSSMIRPSTRMNFGLFKYASFFMLGSMLIFAAQGL
jgi:protoheme IX farnesyltransferase